MKIGCAMDKAWKNAVISLLALSLCALASYWSFLHPEATSETASSGISAVSIVSSLSIALTSILAQKLRLSQSISTNIVDLRSIKRAIDEDNERISSRQGILMFVSMTAIVSGMFLIALTDAYKDGLSSRITSAIYCFSSLSSFIWAVFVAKALSETVVRNRSLEQ